MARKHKRSRPLTDLQKMERLAEIYKRIEKESAGVCSEECIMYDSGICSPNPGFRCQILSRESSRG
jgi:hypothetical protein